MPPIKLTSLLMAGVGTPVAKISIVCVTPAESASVADRLCKFKAGQHRVAINSHRYRRARIGGEGRQVSHRQVGGGCQGSGGQLGAVREQAIPLGHHGRARGDVLFARQSIRQGTCTLTSSAVAFARK